VAGCYDEAIAVTDGLIETAEATHNPWALSFALLAYGLACRRPQAEHALDALRRGLMIAHESGNRANESHLLGVLGRLEAEDGEPLAALDYLRGSIRNYHDAGILANMLGPLAILVALLDRLGRHVPAATIAGFAFSPLTGGAFPEIHTAITHLRDVLGDQTYDSLARKGNAMTTAEMVAYAYDQIDQARRELNAVSK
jgi:hypothetical protein